MQKLHSLIGTFNTLDPLRLFLALCPGTTVNGYPSLSSGLLAWVLDSCSRTSTTLLTPLLRLLFACHFDLCPTSARPLPRQMPRPSSLDLDALSLGLMPVFSFLIDLVISASMVAIFPNSMVLDFFSWYLPTEWMMFTCVIHSLRHTQC